MDRQYDLLNMKAIDAYFYNVQFETSEELLYTPADEEETQSYDDLFHGGKPFEKIGKP